MNKLEKEKQNHQKFLKTKQTAILKTVPLSLILTVPVSTNNSSSAIAFAPLKKLPVPGLNLQKRKSITPMSALNAKRPKESSPTKDKVHATKDSLTKCLDKISSLSQDGRNRVMEKSELNYRNHR